MNAEFGDFYSSLSRATGVLNIIKSLVNSAPRIGCKLWEFVSKRCASC